MPSQTSDQSEYTMGYSEEFLQLLHRRSLEKDAAYSDPDDVAFIGKVI